MNDDQVSENFNYNFDAFTELSSIGKYFEQEEIVCALEINSICSGNEAIITILCYEEIINLKINIDRKNFQNPLTTTKIPTRIKNISGRKIIANKTSTFLLSRDGNLSKFKSSKALVDVTNLVLYLECFYIKNDECNFLLIALEENRVVLQIYNKLFEAGDYVCPIREIEIISKDEQIIGNVFNITTLLQDFVFASELIADIRNNEATVEFFNAFLNIDIKQIGMKEILLLSCNERLLLIKYHDNNRENMKIDDEEEEEEDEMISIEPVLISKGKIKAIKFFNNALFIIDDFWTLTIYFYCSSTRIIKKKEIPLIGNVTCFRFTGHYLIYSNQHKIIFMEFLIPFEEPDVFEVQLSMIITFTIIQNFLLAIDKNHFFYYVPIRQPIFIHDRVKNKNQYHEITDANILEIPKAVQFLKSKENEFKALIDEIDYERNLKILLDYLSQKKDFLAGAAEIEYLPTLPKNIQENDIVCKPTNARAGRTYIKIDVSLMDFLNSFKFVISFYRHTKNNGTIVRNIIKEKNKTEFSIYVPAELEDDSKSHIEIFVQFDFSSSNDKHVLQFPINIKEIKENEFYNSIAPTEKDECFKILSDIIKTNNL
ncbi:hypothetical protein PVAND_009554 [Polypedilum vanderplanki]|uniref:Uncharacterized protein n=1 Tax=Polypedilum vanderplanki TaxID=319348 RepID=A0A9J6CDM0_POLVA|nr:hypothetical protein PVAND_009554 [Polypedilum vanderplanki]